jgi:hypothetical protein
VENNATVNYYPNIPCQDIEHFPASCDAENNKLYGRIERGCSKERAIAGM